MAIIWVEREYAFSGGDIRFPGHDRDSLWLEVKWTDGNRRASLTIERFPGITPADIFGDHTFANANDSDQGWDGQHVITFYDGIHAYLYNGRISFTRVKKGIRVHGFGLVADGEDQIAEGSGERLDFDEVVPSEFGEKASVQKKVPRKPAPAQAKREKTPAPSTRPKLKRPQRSEKPRRAPRTGT